LGVFGRAAPVIATRALAVTAAQGSPLRRALSARWLRSLGRYSYAIYILHLPLVKILFEVSATREFISGRFGGVIVLAVVLPVAYALAGVTCGPTSSNPASR